MKRATLAVLFPVLPFFSAATIAQEQTGSPIVQQTYWPTHGWRSSTPEESWTSERRASGNRRG